MLSMNRLRAPDDFKFTVRLDNNVMESVGISRCPALRRVTDVVAVFKDMAALRG